jgi:hypothetical protein
MSSNISPESGFDTLKNAFEKFEGEHGELKMKKEEGSFFSIMNLGLLAAGGYALWANRFRIQRFLEANGISTPWMNNNMVEGVKSGAAKVAGSVEHEFDSLTRPSKESNSVPKIGKEGQKSVSSY